MYPLLRKNFCGTNFTDPWCRRTTCCERSLERTLLTRGVDLTVVAKELLWNELYWPVVSTAKGLWNELYWPVASTYVLLRKNCGANFADPWCLRTRCCERSFVEQIYNELYLLVVSTYQVFQRIFCGTNFTDLWCRRTACGERTSVNFTGPWGRRTRCCVRSVEHTLLTRGVDVPVVTKELLWNQLHWSVVSTYPLLRKVCGTNTRGVDVPVVAKKLWNDLYWPVVSTYQVLRKVCGTNFTDPWCRRTACGERTSVNFTDSWCRRTRCCQRTSVERTLLTRGVDVPGVAKGLWNELNLLVVSTYQVFRMNFCGTNFTDLWCRRTACGERTSVERTLLILGVDVPLATQNEIPPS